MKPWARNLILKKFSSEKFQNPQIDRNAAIEILEQQYRTGEMVFLGNENKNILFMVKPTTWWVAGIEILAETNNPSSVVIEAKKALEWVWLNTNLHKLTAEIIDPRIGVWLKKSGFKKEGVSKESYLKYDDGVWLDEHIYSIIRPKES